MGVGGWVRVRGQGSGVRGQLHVADILVVHPLKQSTNGESGSGSGSGVGGQGQGQGSGVGVRGLLHVADILVVHPLKQSTNGESGSGVRGQRLGVGVRGRGIFFSNLYHVFYIYWKSLTYRV